MSDTEAGMERGAWYVRRAGEVRGPFAAAQVARYIVLGRVRLGDEVSRDGTAWVPLGSRSELLPAGLEELSNEDTLWRLRLREDERSGVDRRAGQVPSPEIAERRSGKERRRPEPEALVRARRKRQDFLRDVRRSAPSRRGWAWLGVAATLALVTTVAVLTTKPQPPSGPHCNADPAPGVDWHDCRLEGLDVAGLDLSGALLRNAKAREARMTQTRLPRADLAYADLARANLAAADLSGASLVGTNLSGADLSAADLSGADLRYADLTRARLQGARLEGAALGRAVWVDGRLCAPQSVGSCARE